MGRTRGKIFIVEDDVDTQKFLSLVVTQIGFTPRIIRDIDALEEALEISSPVGYIMDVGLPKEDGISIVEKLKKRPMEADKPIIAISAHWNLPDMNVQAQALAAGCHAFLSKPIMPDQLMKELDELFPE